MNVLLTCEHAGNKVPKEFSKLFQGRQKLLSSHRGWDEGALGIARGLKQKLKAPLIEGKYSRLVIDLNRSENHRKAFSEFTAHLPQEIKEKIISKIHRPFRQKAEAIVSNQSKTLHISIHSFVPILNGKKRNCEIGILYDPQRPLEVKTASELKSYLEASDLHPRVRLNYPYRGYSDGHTTKLRKIHSPEEYIGIEIELNQGWLKELKQNKQLIHLLAASIQRAKIL